MQSRHGLATSLQAQQTHSDCNSGVTDEIFEVANTGLLLHDVSLRIRRSGAGS
jgi:hypothetical protein